MAKNLLSFSRGKRRHSRGASPDVTPVLDVVSCSSGCGDSCGVALPFLLTDHSVSTIAIELVNLQVS